MGDYWIVWREKFVDGELCGPNKDGKPNPKDSENAYAMPDGYSDDCVWFPSNTSLPYFGIDYGSVLIYGMTLILLLTGTSLLLFLI